MINLCPYCKSKNVRIIRTKKATGKHWIQTTSTILCKDCKGTWEEQLISSLPNQPWEVKPEAGK